MIEKKFVEDGITRMRAKEFVKNEVAKAGIVNINIQRTTLSTRISLLAENPGIVIGRKGKGIKDLADVIETKMKLENPQIEVSNVDEKGLEPAIIGNWIIRMLERGFKPKRAMSKALYRVMSAHAIGCEIIVKGVVRGKGKKAGKLRVSAGYLKKAGHGKELVKEFNGRAVLKQGVIGVTVRIVPPDVIFPDKMIMPKVEEPTEVKEVEENGDNKKERTESNE